LRGFKLAAIDLGGESKYSGHELGLVVVMFDLCLSLFGSLDPGLEGVLEFGAGRVAPHHGAYIEDE
jgi:hypothetical protein